MSARLTEKQRASALARDVTDFKEKSAAKLTKFLAANEDHDRRALAAVCDEATTLAYAQARVQTRAPFGRWRDLEPHARSVQALLNKTDYERRSLRPTALEEYHGLLLGYAVELRRLNAMKNARQGALRL